MEQAFIAGELRDKLAVGIDFFKRSSRNHVEYNRVLIGDVSLPASCPSEPEGPDEEYGHLGAGNRVIRTVVATTTTTRDALCRQLLYPGHRPVARIHIGKRSASRRRRDIVRTMPGP